MKIEGYIRENGDCGIRNHLLIIPSSVCGYVTARNIANQINGAIAIANQHGCCQVKPDMDLVEKTLVGLGCNPNVGAVLVIGLGCDGIQAKDVSDKIKEKTGKDSRYLVIQECGGTLSTMSKGLAIAREMAQKLSVMKKSEFDISKLRLAMECGGSDFTSGLISNPIHGKVSDKLISLGGTSMFSETAEIIGAEHVMARRAVNKEDADKLIKMVRDCEEKAKSMGVDFRGSQPTPGNIEGGISSIEEKSLGCIHKGGTSPLMGVLDYSEAPGGKGLYIMDTPGQDIESMTGMIAGGCQICIFTTGRGTPTGFPIAPVIKITGNYETYNKMSENIDISAGDVLLGKETLDEAAERLWNEIIAVCNGKQTKTEALGHDEFGMYKLTSTF
ncbi:UxaA family hydrolase [Brachyspira aalborgi]|uniref:UxaA family hydrolase n=1 Tax=Brachyspira aalborgi TaxID=29522 RepID=UPI00266D3472|nr:UxaA family hydrolase [Brachyspira aalborgi]